MTILACGCVLDFERCIDCRPGLDPDQEKALAITMASEPPLWTADALSRLLGAIDGYAKALVALRTKIAHFDGVYAGRFPAHHRRKIAARDAITKPMRELASDIENNLRECQHVYKRESARRDALRAA